MLKLLLSAEMVFEMPKVSPEEISLKIKSLMDELTALEVHLVVLASYTNKGGNVVFGLETNTSQKVAASLLKAGGMRLRDCEPADARTYSS